VNRIELALGLILDQLEILTSLIARVNSVPDPTTARAARDKDQVGDVVETWSRT